MLVVWIVWWFMVAWMLVECFSLVHALYQFVEKRQLNIFYQTIYCLNTSFLLLHHCLIDIVKIYQHRLIGMGKIYQHFQVFWLPDRHCISWVWSPYGIKPLLQRQMNGLKNGGSWYKYSRGLTLMTLTIVSTNYFIFMKTYRQIAYHIFVFLEHV